MKHIHALFLIFSIGTVLPQISLAIENITINGLCHITGGGLMENIPRILPDGCDVGIRKGSWSSVPVFDVMQSIGNVDEGEMYRTFNMGIGMVFIVDSANVDNVKDIFKELIKVYEIGNILSGNGKVIIK